MKIEDYFKVSTIRDNEDFLYGHYREEFGFVSSEEVVKAMVKAKNGIKKINTSNMKILDVSGNSLLSPLLVFENYDTYDMLVDGKNHYQKWWQINNQFFKETGSNWNINYVDDYKKNYYDMIVDWNGVINFGLNFNRKMFSILMDMIYYTKKYIVFETVPKLKVKNIQENLEEFYKNASLILENDGNIKYSYINIERYLTNKNLQYYNWPLPEWTLAPKMQFYVGWKND